MREEYAEKENGAEHIAPRHSNISDVFGNIYP
jgi:hypothetical protein